MSQTLSGLFIVAEKQERDKSGKSTDNPQANQENREKSRESPKKDKESSKTKTLQMVTLQMKI